MKECIKTICRIAFICFAVFLFAFVLYDSTHYEREATITGIEKDIVTVNDTCGYEWKFKGEGFSIGEDVTLVMHNNNTDMEITDDIIERVDKREDN